MIAINFLYRIPRSRQRKMSIIFLVKGSLLFILFKTLSVLFGFDSNNIYLNCVLYGISVLYVVYHCLRIYSFQFSFGEENITVYCGLRGKIRDRISYKKIEKVKKGDDIYIDVYVKKDHEEIGIFDSAPFVLGCTKKRGLYRLYLTERCMNSAYSFLIEKIKRDEE